MIDKIIESLEAMAEDMRAMGDMEKASGVDSALWLIEEMTKKADTLQTDCDKCIWSVCNYNKVDWDANTPQTELTAKCLNCRNAKACKENHWDGCIYEPQTDCNDIYPLVIIKDRYTGVYSNGKYTAWNMYFEDIPREIDEDDVTCHNFWHSYNGIVGLGKTPNEAIDDLHKKLNVERNE